MVRHCGYTWSDVLEERVSRTFYSLEKLSEEAEEKQEQNKKMKKQSKKAKSKV